MKKILNQHAVTEMLKQTKTHRQRTNLQLLQVAGQIKCVAKPYL